MVQYRQLCFDGVQHELVHFIDLLEVMLYAILTLQGIVLVFCECPQALICSSLSLPIEGILLYLVSLRLHDVQLLEIAQLLVLDDIAHSAYVAHLALASHALVPDLAKVVAWAHPPRRSGAINLLEVGQCSTS